MTNTEIALRPSYWANVSGGKDSLYMLSIILRNPDKYPLDGVIHFELEIDYPFVKRVIDQMEKDCTARGIKFVRIRPREQWNDLYEKWGFPTMRNRWCNSSYKLDARRQLDDYMKSIGYYVISYIGYCSDETKRYEKRTGNVTEVYPLVIEGIKESTILEWARDVPLFENYYKTNKRCGCMYCPMANRMELAWLLKYYPDVYTDVMQKRRETEHKKSAELGRKFTILPQSRKYDTDYLDNNIRTKWLMKLNDMEEHNK